MKCPACDSTKIHTYDTRRVDNMVVRKRKCVNCEDRFYTLEQYMSEDELEEVQQLRKNNGGKVLYGVPDDTGHSRGDNTEDRPDKPLDMPALLGEAELESILKDRDQ